MQQPPRTAVASGMLLLGLTVLSMAVAAASEVEPPLPPLPPFASAPPVGVILEDSAVDESDAAVDIQLVAAELLLVQSTGNGKSASETPSQTQAAEQEQREQQEKKDQESSAKSCGEQSKDCQQALKALRDDGLETIALDIRVSGRPGSDYPCECRLEGESYQPRRFATTMMTWKAAGNCHKPLYFEDWNLERYGHSHGPLDPIFSAAHFFVTLPVLPYKMGVELPWECVYPLGYYRPGNCAPWTVPAVPISCRGFAVEAATVTGLVFLLP